MNKRINIKLIMVGLIFLNPYAMISVSAKYFVDYDQQDFDLPSTYTINAGMAISDDTFILIGSFIELENSKNITKGWVRAYTDNALVWEQILGGNVSYNTEYYDPSINETVVYTTNFSALNVEFNSAAFANDLIYLYGSWWHEGTNKVPIRVNTRIGDNEIFPFVDSGSTNGIDILVNLSETIVNSISYDITRIITIAQYTSQDDNKIGISIATEINGDVFCRCVNRLSYLAPSITNSTWSSALILSAGGSEKLFFADKWGRLVLVDIETHYYEMEMGSVDEIWSEDRSVEKIIREKRVEDFILVELDVIPYENGYYIIELGYIGNSWKMYLNNYNLDIDELIWSNEFSPASQRKNFFLEKIGEDLYLLYLSQETQELAIHLLDASGETKVEKILNDIIPYSMFVMDNELHIIVMKENKYEILHIEVSNPNFVTSSLKITTQFFKDYPIAWLGLISIIWINYKIIQKIRKNKKLKNNQSELYPK